VLVNSDDIIKLFKVTKNKLVKSKADFPLKTVRVKGQSFYALSDILKLLSDYMNKEDEK
jgi:hypothetical protein